MYHLTIILFSVEVDEENESLEKTFDIKNFKNSLICN